MTVSQTYLEAVRDALGGCSYYRAAKALEITDQAVSNLRHGRTHMSDCTALRAARLLGISPLKVVADLHLEKAGDPEEITFWATLAGTVKNGRGYLSRSHFETEKRA